LRGRTGETRGRLLTDVWDRERMHMEFRSPCRKARCFERLESRQLMAGNISAYVDGQMLVLWGDADGNGATLTYESATRTYRVSGHDAGSGPTTINGLDTSQRS